MPSRKVKAKNRRTFYGSAGQAICKDSVVWHLNGLPHQKKVPLHFCAFLLFDFPLSRKMMGTGIGADAAAEAAWTGMKYIP
jgi:hypothetical protein